MARFGLPSHLEMNSALIKAYAEKHRAYHTLDHIDACFSQLDCVEEQADRPHEIEMAIWFHDVIYKPFSGSNEEDSADVAKLFLAQNNVDPDCIDRIYNLIILTKNHTAPETADAQIMLDIDLSILGAPPKVYAQFEKDVRQEYKKVPAYIFRKKRKEILQSFLARPSLYNRPYFFERLETQAKQNLSAAIEAL